MYGHALLGVLSHVELTLAHLELFLAEPYLRACNALFVCCGGPVLNAWVYDNAGALILHRVDEVALEDLNVAILLCKCSVAIGLAEDLKSGE